MKAVLLVLSLALLSCQRPAHQPRQTFAMSYQQRAQELGQPELAPLLQTMDAVKPLHTLMGKPKRFDWLEAHPEPGQTFVEYLNSNPVLPDAKRRIIYVQPLGDFTEPQRKIVTLTADYLERFFNLPVKLLPDLPLSLVPKRARRRSPAEKGEEQLLTSYVLEQLLKPRLPQDAVVLTAFTATDLWPGQGWNFVFGMASLQDRVGVWSMRRFGDLDPIYGDFELCLLRTLKVASHETGHMFSMPHCTKYECNLSGSNHLGETDSRGLDVCPECMAKICWGMRYDPVQRYQRLAEFCQQQSLSADRKHFAAALKAAQQGQQNTP